MSFSDLGLLPELLRAVADKGYDTPSPIQIQAIPAVLSGRDVLAGAQTGTGKTAGFVLPILQRLAADQGPGARRAAALAALGVTGHAFLGIDFRAPRAGVVEILQHQARRPLAQQLNCETVRSRHVALLISQRSWP